MRKNFLEKLRLNRILYLEQGSKENHLLDGLLVGNQLYLLGLIVYEYLFFPFKEHRILSLSMSGFGGLLSIFSVTFARFKKTATLSLALRYLILVNLLVTFAIEKLCFIKKQEEISILALRHEEVLNSAFFLCAYACMYRFLNELLVLAHVAVIYMLWISIFFWEIKEFKKIPVHFVVILISPLAIFFLIASLKRKEEGQNTVSAKTMKNMLMMSSVGIVLIENAEKIIFSTSSVNSNLFLGGNATDDEVLRRIKKLSLVSYRKIESMKHIEDWHGKKRILTSLQAFQVGVKLEDVIRSLSEEAPGSPNLSRVFYTKTSKQQEAARIDQDFHDKLISTTDPLHEIDPKGETRHFEVRISRMVNAEPLNDAYLLIFNDITDAQTIRENEVDIEFKTNMLNSFSHELKTPLNISRNILECAVEDQAIPSFLKDKYLNHPVSSLKLLTYLIQDIIDYLKLETGQLVMELEPFSLRGLVNEVIAALSSRTREKRIELLTGDLSVLRGYVLNSDKNRLRRVLLNLIQNCIKYTERGSIIISARQHQKAPGIALEIQDTRFTEYRRRQEILDPSPRRSRDVANMKKDFSLVISKLMLQALSIHGIDGPEIEYRPEGLLVKILFPANSQSALLSVNLSSDNRMGSSIEELQRARKPFGTKINHSKLIEVSQKEAKSQRLCPRALIVDDDPFNLVSLEMLLSKFNVHCVKADDGLKAVNALTAFFATHTSCPPTCKGISCIFMDLCMPVMDGLESARKIRELVEVGALPNIPIIACSANDSKDDVRASKEAGMSNFISKPVSKQTLEAALSTCETQLGFKIID